MNHDIRFIRIELDIENWIDQPHHTGGLNGIELDKGVFEHAFLYIRVGACAKEGVIRVVHLLPALFIFLFPVWPCGNPPLPLMGWNLYEICSSLFDLTKDAYQAVGV